MSGNPTYLTIDCRAKAERNTLMSQFAGSETTQLSVKTLNRAFAPEESPRSIPGLSLKAPRVARV